MLPIKRILLATDFSECSTHATAYAAELAAKFDAPIVLLHAYTAPVVYLPEGVWTMPEMNVDLRMQLNKALEKATQSLRAAGATKVEAFLADGVPWQEIVRAATDRKCDLIIMGTHGRGGLQHLLLGSVAEKVVRKAPCAVLTVR